MLTNNNKNVLITGSGGFIGSHLLNFLKEKYTVLAPRSFELDLLDECSVSEYFSKNNVDVIIHSASCGVRINSADTMQEVAYKNIKMFENISENIASNCYLINIGSGAEYDKSRNLEKVKESDFNKFVPKDQYGYSKYKIAEIIEKSSQMLNLRFFGVYGVGENPTRFPSYAISQNIKHESIIIRQNAIFDYLYIDDAVKIIDYFIQNPVVQKSINVTPTHSVDLITIANIVNKISDNKSEIIIEKQEMNFEYTGSNNLLLNYIPYFNFTSIQEGLNILFQNNKNSYNNPKENKL